MKILSGGQTGVDRAALDAALAAGIAYAGWCPQGGWAEDLPRAPGLLARYPKLQETPGTDPLQRTEWNVRDADRLLVLIDGTGLEASKGTIAARAFAARLGRPYLLSISTQRMHWGGQLPSWACPMRERRSASPVRVKAKRRASTPRRNRCYAPLWPPVLERLTISNMTGAI
jgi:hypothetical protein